MGRIITSPDKLEHPFQKSIFLAGGISDCEDWQLAVAERIAEKTDAVVYNPRRVDFDMDAGEALSRVQIRWEYHALRICQFNLFWFPEETLCPITLMEYGSAMERIRVGGLMCGTHPNYKRRFDIIEQTALMNHVPVFDDLDHLVDQTILMLGGKP
jgi:hypothetical protein